MLASEDNIAYVKANSNVIIRKVNNEEVTPFFYEYIKSGGQEVINQAGDVVFVLSYYHTSSIPQVVKINTKVKEEQVTFKLESGKAYMIDYSSDDGFIIEPFDGMKFATGLYKKFKSKFGL